MAKSLSEKFKHELEAFFIGPIFPFLQKNWWAKIWFFIPLSYVPFLNLIIGRGWRLELVHRMGWKDKQVLPPPIEAYKYFKNGLLLWLATFMYLLIPIFIISFFGLGGFRDLLNDVEYVITLTWSFIWERTLSLNEYISQLWEFTKQELVDTFLAFMIQNIYLVIYLPIYRIGMVRFALTKNLIASHLNIFKNLKFLFVNIIDIILMYIFKYLGFVITITVDLILSMTVIGIPFIPIVTFGMYYWTTGYGFGLIAELMVEQEKMQPNKKVLKGQQQDNYRERAVV